MAEEERKKREILGPPPFWAPAFKVLFAQLVLFLLFLLLLQICLNCCFCFVAAAAGAFRSLTVEIPIFSSFLTFQNVFAACSVVCNLLLNSQLLELCQR